MGQCNSCNCDNCGDNFPNEFQYEVVQYYFIILRLQAIIILEVSLRKVLKSVSKRSTPDNPHKHIHNHISKVLFCLTQIITGSRTSTTLSKFNQLTEAISHEDTQDWQRDIRRAANISLSLKHMKQFQTVRTCFIYRFHQQNLTKSKNERNEKLTHLNQELCMRENGKEALEMESDNRFGRMVLLISVSGP